MEKIKKGFKEAYMLLGALAMGYYKLATPQRDKFIHWMAGIYLFMVLSLFITNWMAFLLVSVIGIAKELIWDKYLGRGMFEYWDMAYTIFGGLSIFAYVELLKYIAQ